MSVEAWPDSAAIHAGFMRVLCGIDGTPESIEAARQAEALTGPGGQLELVSVVDMGEAVLGGIHAAEVGRDLKARAQRGLERAQAAATRGTIALVRGRPVRTLPTLASGRRADLLAVGSHDASRVAGITLGSVATALIHKAPCSVLVTRPSPVGAFPGSILVATDGSRDARNAGRVAAGIAARHGSRVTVLHVAAHEAGHSIGADQARIAETTGEEPWVEVRIGSPRHQILDFANDCEASLVVVGHRGLGGLRSLGSVSETVAHRARCSVLIVREDQEG
jgi:nucleotide-binding universal stress UspA family protein